MKNVRKVQDYIESYALLQHMFRTKYWVQETEGSDTDIIQEVSSTLHEVLEEIFNVRKAPNTHTVKSGSDDKSDYRIQITGHYLAIMRFLSVWQPNNLTLSVAIFVCTTVLRHSGLQLGYRHNKQK
jgi:phage gpG-like protein